MVNLFMLLFLNDAGGDALDDLQSFEIHAEIIFSILTKVFVIGLVLIAFVYIIRVLMDKSYSIRYINMPESLVQAGHTGPVVANRIYYRLQQIIQRVSANYHLKGYSTAAAEKEVSVDVAGMGLPIKGFVELLGGALGIQRSKKVDADFFLENKNLVMLLKISGHPAERFEIPCHDSTDAALKLLITEAAETILKYSNDEVLQTYFGLVEQIGEKQIKLARYRYENCRINDQAEVNIIAAWAWGLCMLKRYEEAEEKIKEGVARHKKAGRIYVIWGSLLTQLGRPEEALEKFNKALEQVSKNESITRIANIYSTIGNCYLRMGKNDLARDYMQKAIQADPKSSRVYYNLACLHLSNNDENQFFEMLEKAFENGFQKQNIVKDPRCAGMMQHPRVVRLLEKYGE